MSGTEDQSPQETEPAGLDAILDSAIQSSDEANAASENPPSETPAVDEDVHPNDPTRRRNGKFRGTKHTDVAAEAPTGPAEVVTDPASTPTGEPAVQPLEAPARWSEADKAMFAKQPPEVQQFLVERSKAMEADYTRKTQEISETRRGIEPFVNVVSKWSQFFQQEQMNPSVVFDQLLGAEFILRRGSPDDKRAALDHLEKYYGVPPKSADGGQQPITPSDDDWVDPRVQTLEQKLNQVFGYLNHEAQAAAERQLQSAQAEFAALGEAKKDDGSLKFPEFQRVQKRMIKLVAEGDADTWDTAYDMAVWMDPELRTSKIEADRVAAAKAAVSAEEQRRQEAIGKASRAAPVRTGHGGKGNTAPRGLDAILDKSINERLG